MALLRDNPDELGVLLTRASAWYSDQRGVNILPVIVEKDFWVTEALRLLSVSHQYGAPTQDSYPVIVRSVLKGGTSLS